MKNQEILNGIAILTGTIDPLIRTKNTKAVETVTNKLLEMVAKLK